MFSKRARAAALIVPVLLCAAAGCSSSDQPVAPDAEGVEPTLAQARAAGHVDGIDALIAAQFNAWAGIAVREGGDWRIMHQQMTPLPPSA